MSCDLIICTKNRNSLLKTTIEKIKSTTNFDNVIVVESSESPNKLFLEKIADRVIYTPNAKLGQARHRGLLASQADYVFYLDDDIVVKEDTFDLLLNEMQNENVVAVSGKVVYGFNSDEVLLKLFSNGKLAKTVHSAGFVLMKRKAILELGGYNTNLHWGEDLELAHRIERKGLLWLGCPDAISYHEATFKEQIKRSWYNGQGLKISWLHGKSLSRMFTQFFGKTFIMPIYYCFKTRDPRVSVYYLTINLVALFAFGLGLKDEI